jgi:NADPH-dependent 7-cyano-7-deazaguanine reductase QueF
MYTHNESFNTNCKSHDLLIVHNQQFLGSHLSAFRNTNRPHETCWSHPILHQCKQVCSEVRSSDANRFNRLHQMLWP